MSHRVQPEVLELTASQFRDMLEEFAHHEHGPLGHEARQLLADYDVEQCIKAQRLIANRWTVAYQAHRSRHHSALTHAIVLNMSIEDRLIAAKDALRSTMITLITLYNQLYDALRQRNNPDAAAVAAFGVAMQQHYPGIGLFLNSSPERIEDAGGAQAQLDMVTDLLLAHHRDEIGQLFQIAEPQPDRQQPVQGNAYHVTIGDTQIEVVTHPRMNVHLALELGGLATIDQQ